MKNKIINLTGRLVYRTSWFSRSLLSFRKKSLRIIYYHLVTNQEPDYYFTGAAIDSSTFREQMVFFKKNYHIISLSEAKALAANSESLERKLVLTFDDGFAHCYHEIAPILNELKIPATFFLISNCIDNHDLMWRNKLLVIKKTEKNKLQQAVNESIDAFKLNSSERGNLLKWSFMNWSMQDKDDICNFLWDKTQNTEIKEYLEEYRPYLSITQIEEMQQMGFDFGAHSCSHPRFDRLDYSEFENEILHSAEKIESITKSPVMNFSYPFGVTSPLEFESEFLSKKRADFLFLGTQNSLRNVVANSQWQRDNAEFDHPEMMFSFTVLPVVRYLAPMFLSR